MLVQSPKKDPNHILSHLFTLKEDGVIRLIDYHFSLFIYQICEDDVLVLVSAWASSESGKGNSCVDVSTIYAPRNRATCFDLSDKKHQSLLDTLTIPPRQWITHLSALPPVGDGSSPTPFVCWRNRLYLHRYWLFETTIVNWLKKQYIPPLNMNNSECKAIIDRLFTEKSNETNWQKVAAALAVLTSFSVITGGPGTGKTTTVTRLMALLIELSSTQQSPLIITLAAPTGKASARLSQSVQQATEKLNCSSQIKHLIPKQAVTIHQLLGAHPHKSAYRFNAENQLHTDILIVDEASMIDISMMARLLQALKPETKLILLGDHYQLASVEAGHVLGDICYFSGIPYSKDLLTQLESITNEPIAKKFSEKTTNKYIPVNNHLCVLRKSYRFRDDSGIGYLATAINSGDTDRAEAAWHKSFTDITLVIPSSSYKSVLLETATKGYANYLKAINSNADINTIFSKFNHFQILCALRDDEYGVSGLNEFIKKGLQKSGLIPATNHTWYCGRPVMISRNDYSLGLFNGDIGITVKDDDDKLRVVFIMPDGTIQKLLPNRLPEHETVYAMTIHKSQGSEFDHTTIVLPESDSPLLTRELLYTGVTRAKKKLTLFGHPKLIAHTIGQHTQRTSGIIDRLEQ